MVDELNKALTILLVGMTTVFFILSIVVIVGNVLIRFLNRTDFILNKKDKSHIVSDKEKDIIATAISKWSNEQARVTEITRN